MAFAKTVMIVFGMKKQKQNGGQMRKIVVEIDCDEERCEPCPYYRTTKKAHDIIMPGCALFNKDLPFGLRCTQCLAAEIEGE